VCNNSKRRVLGSGAALAGNSLPGTLEELVCGSPGASEPLSTEYIGWPQYLVVFRKHAAIALRPPFRCGLYPMQLGRHQGRGDARLWMLLFAWTKF
jgi:hypothetical protein